MRDTDNATSEDAKSMSAFIWTQGKLVESFCFSLKIQRLNASAQSSGGANT